MRILKIKSPLELNPQIEKDIQIGTNMVGVFAEWCHNCREMQPEWEKFTNSMRGEKLNGKIITIYEPAYRESKCKTCFEKVMGYPTIMMLKDGVQLSEFKGMPREMEYFRNYAKENMKEIIPTDSDAKINKRFEKKIAKITKKIKRKRRSRRTRKIDRGKAIREKKRRRRRRKKTKRYEENKKKRDRRKSARMKVRTKKRRKNKRRKQN